MITIILISHFGRKWGKEWVQYGVITEEKRLELGYIGCFFGKIFGI